MVFINSRGEVVEGGRINWRRPINSFLAIVSIFMSFFFSLISPITQLINPNSRYSNNGDFRNNGGNGRRPGDGGPRRRGGFMTTSDIAPPPLPGCSSCG